MRLLIFITIFIINLLCSVAIAGDDKLKQAVALWLDGDDKQSLPMLAKLAGRGDPDARLLLARLEYMDRGRSPYLRSLSAAQLKNMHRSHNSKTKFAVSWLEIEAQQGNELAVLLQKTRLPYANISLIEKLHSMGEAQASDHPTRISALYGSSAERNALLKNDAVLSELRPYVRYLTTAPEPRGDGMSALRYMVPELADKVNKDNIDALDMAGVLALGYGFGRMNQSNPWYEGVANWVLSNEATRPILTLCSRKCGDEIPNCAMMLMALTGGYYEVIRLDSPLERLISQTDFLNSPRAELMAIRRAALTRAETDEELGSIHEIAKHSVCAANMIDFYRHEQP